MEEKIAKNEEATEDLLQMASNLPDSKGEK